MLLRYSAARVVCAASTYLGTLVYSHILGSHDFGVVATLLTVLTVSMGLDLGLYNMLSTHAATAKNKREDIRAPVLANGLLMVVAAVSFWLIVPVVYQTLSVKQSCLLSLCLFAYIATSVALSPALNLALLQGELRRAVAVNGLHTILRVLVNVVFFMLFHGGNLPDLVLGFLILNIALNLLIVAYARFGSLVLAAPSQGWRPTWKTIKFIIPTVGYALASVAFANADKGVASFLLQPAEYGQYFFACALIMCSYALYASAVGSYLIPIVSRGIKASASQARELSGCWMRFHTAVLSLIYVGILWAVHAAQLLGTAALTYSPMVYSVLSIGYFFNYCTLGFSPTIVAHGSWHIPLEASLIGCVAWGLAMASLGKVDVPQIAAITGGILLMNYFYQWFRLRAQVHIGLIDLLFTLAPIVITAGELSHARVSPVLHHLLLALAAAFLLHRAIKALKTIKT